MPLTSPYYPLDTSGKKEENKIECEVHTITEPTKTLPPIIIPKWAPFYADVDYFTITTEGETLVEGVDFEYCYRFNEARTHFGKDFFGGIYIKNKQLYGKVVKIGYNTLGTDFAVASSTIIIDATRSLTEARTKFWDQIVGVPYKLPPLDHLEDLADLKGWDDVVEGVKGIDAALRETSQALTGRLENLEQVVGDHLQDKVNPHETTQTHTGLGRVSNNSTADKEAAKSKDIDDRFMTPAGTYEHLKANYHEFIKDHTEDPSLHPQSLKGVGGDNLNNWRVANPREAQEYRDKFYMTPLRTKDVFNKAVAMETVAIYNPKDWLGDQAKFLSTAPGLPLRRSGVVSDEPWYIYNKFMPATFDNTDPYNERNNGKPKITTERLQYAYDFVEHRWYSRKLNSANYVEWETNMDRENTAILEGKMPRSIIVMDFNALPELQEHRSGDFNRRVSGSSPNSPDSSRPTVNWHVRQLFSDNSQFNVTQVAIADTNDDGLQSTASRTRVNGNWSQWNHYIQGHGQQVITGPIAFQGNLPRSSIVPSNADDLTNKAYVDKMMGSSGDLNNYRWREISIGNNTWWTNTYPLTVFICMLIYSSRSDVTYAHVRREELPGKPLIQVYVGRGDANRYYGYSGSSTIPLNPGDSFKGYGGGSSVYKIFRP